MWLCKKCNHKNSNSSLNCHGLNCDGKQETDHFESPTIEIKNEKPKKRIYDYCPVHQKDVVFVESRWHGKKVWRCTHGGHKPCILIGKSKPFPIELMTEEEREKYLQKVNNI